MTRRLIVDEGQHLCKMIGHAWIPQAQAKSGWTPSWGIGLVLECERCGAERRDVIDQTGALSSRSYQHPPGYKYEPGQDRPTRADLRRMWVRHRRLPTVS